MLTDDPPQQEAAEFRPDGSAQEVAEAELIFKALAEKGTVQMPVQEYFWALRFGHVVDRFGMPWLINCEKPAV
jgi:PhnB protein